MLGECDVVINGKGDTATIAGPAYPEDEGLDIIRSHPTKHEGCYRRIRRSQKSRVKAGKKKLSCLSEGRILDTAIAAVCDPFLHCERSSILPRCRCRMNPISLSRCP